MYDKDEFGDPTLCYCPAAEAWQPETKLQQITSRYLFYKHFEKDFCFV